MKIKRFTVLCAWMLMLALLLSACGGKTTEPAKPSTPSGETEQVSESDESDKSDESGDPESAGSSDSRIQETEPEDEGTIEELYEKTAMDHVFKLSRIDTEGYSIEAACFQDGYVLLQMHSISERRDDSVQGRIILFPLTRPSAAVNMDIESMEASYTLLAGGTVLGVSWEGSYTLYDSSLQETYKETENCGTFLGASEDGGIWFVTDDGSFTLYQGGKQSRTEPVEGMSHGNYLGNSGGKAYFNMFNRYYGWVNCAVDLQNMAYEEIRVLNDAYDARNGLISYSTEDKWYIADCEDPFVVTAFTKPYSNEAVWDMDDRYLIGSTSNYEVSMDSFLHSYHVYDMKNGGMCDQIESSAFSDDEFVILSYDEGMVLLEAHNEEMVTTGLYLWDFSGLSASVPAVSYETYDYHVDQARIDEMISQIYDQYGVTVYYDADHLKDYVSQYELMECRDLELLGQTLIRLQECMAEYPEGFFGEIKGESNHHVVFCLCDAHDRVTDLTIEDAAATVHTQDDTLVMTIDVHYWRELRRTFLHENMHMMETRIGEEMAKITGTDCVQYWYYEMNLPGCWPIQSYIWEQNAETLKGVFAEDPENACYIDWYSKCTISEDHARIMENEIYSASRYYYEAPYIDRKGRFLNAMVRAAFPCVQNSEEVFWEVRTGIVDLYQEFPEFVGK